jgi:hypothetical protein
MKPITCVLIGLATLVAGYTTGYAVGHASADADVTICHSRTQTNCLWIDGTAEQR